MDKNILIIIDMQGDFWASKHKPTQHNILTEIKKARFHKDFIVVLEYGGYGATHKNIMQAVATNYKNWKLLFKYDDDGSDVVAEYLNKAQINPINFRVCGVNASYCVKRTAAGLSVIYQSAKIEVVKKACWCIRENPWDDYYDTWVGGKYGGTLKKMCANVAVS